MTHTHPFVYHCVFNHYEENIYEKQPINHLGLRIKEQEAILI